MDVDGEHGFYQMYLGGKIRSSLYMQARDHAATSAPRGKARMSRICRVQT